MERPIMRTMRTPFPLIGIALICIAFSEPSFSAPSAAAPCGGDFNAWLIEVKREAASAGISQRTIASALDGLVADPAVLARDRSQHVFNQTFEQFSGRMVSADRMQKGAALLTRHAATFARIERQFGVPGPVLTAIWGLETDYGVNQGRFSIIRSVATLAQDCRRAEKFRGELLDLLRIIDRGDMTAGELRGDWAGEIGQTQFLPSSYLQFAVDFDGNGKRDLIHSVPDALASTANYLKSHGWRRGEPWGEGSGNFNVLLEWNKARVYAKTIALFAERLAASSR